MWLLPQQKTSPHIEEHLTRLSAKLPYRQAVEEVERLLHIDISAATAWRITCANGEASDNARQAQVAALSTETIEVENQSSIMQISSDGCMVGLNNGEWREVKTLIIGNVEKQFDTSKKRVEAMLTNVTAISSSQAIRQFEVISTLEIERRGVTQAETVTSLNDGSSWIQSLTDYHCPQAIRILDCRHAQSTLADAGKAVYKEDSPQFKQWYATASDRLINEPPTQTLSRLRLMMTSANESQTEQIEDVYDYLATREAMIDYAHFLKQPYPIGSGAIESSHKQIVQQRMKQAGMRWHLDNVDKMLCLRNLFYNKRWDEGWEQLTRFRLRQHQQRRVKPQPVVPIPDFDAIPTLPEPPPPPEPTKTMPWRPADDHPWRHDIYPDPRFA